MKFSNDECFLIVISRNYSHYGITREVKDLASPDNNGDVSKETSKL